MLCFKEMCCCSESLKCCSSVSATTTTFLIHIKIQKLQLISSSQDSSPSPRAKIAKFAIVFAPWGRSFLFSSEVLLLAGGHLILDAFEDHDVRWPEALSSSSFRDDNKIIRQ